MSKDAPSNDDAATSGSSKRATKRVRRIIRIDDVFLPENDSRRSFSFSIGDFNPDTFARQQQEHIAHYGLKHLKPQGRNFVEGVIITETTNDNNKNSNLNAGNVLSPADYSFFVDPADPLAGGYSVHDDRMRSVAISRGYAEIKIAHLTSVDQLPTLAGKKQTPKNPKENSGLLSKQAPASISVPAGPELPDFLKDTEDTYSSALVRAFEEKFIDSKGGKVYSPCLLWTEEIRKRNGLTIKRPGDKFVSWCTAYCAAKWILTGAILEKVQKAKDLRKAAGTYRRENPFPDKISWYTKAVELSE
eukprot:CAMPEP_0194242656 /NCGR_PEP_ID=MMETSP0158-20130606/8131_1 /TAXON_ID=33649 /ORGANISM="Thalassionema nitzschioides, Strain L26-B" /LENGTH=302 /DNA_ID=CAMNT_0038977797 /DNA_START=20 /DNA_END=925 /DNA_ORIENTATION=-